MSGAKLFGLNLRRKYQVVLKRKAQDPVVQTFSSLTEAQARYAELKKELALSASDHEGFVLECNCGQDRAFKVSCPEAPHRIYDVELTLKGI